MKRQSIQLKTNIKSLKSVKNHRNNHIDKEIKLNRNTVKKTFHPFIEN